MNLKCNKLELWQTPTRISYMCVTQPNGKIAIGVLKGKKAHQALAIYRTWVKYSTNGVWFSEADKAEMYSEINKHLEKIDSLKICEDLEIWVA